MIAFIDTQLRELMAAANQLVPLDLRDTLLTQVADELGGKDLDDHLVHCLAYDVARAITWDTGLASLELSASRQHRTAPQHRAKTDSNPHRSRHQEDGQPKSYRDQGVR
jgi:hypothetical protein